MADNLNSLNNQDFKKITDGIIKEKGLKIKEFEAEAIRSARLALYNEVTIETMKNLYISDNNKKVESRSVTK